MQLFLSHQCGLKWLTHLVTMEIMPRRIKRGVCVWLPDVCVHTSVLGSKSVRSVLNVSKNQAHWVLLSLYAFVDSLKQPQVNVKQGNPILHSQDPMFFPEMCLVFKDACPNVLKTDPPPRHISTTSISEIPGQCPGSHTIFIFIFVSLFFWPPFS